MRKGIINYIGLQLGWFACAWGAANGFAWLGPAVVLLHLGIHLNWSNQRRREMIFFGIVTLIGLVVDSLQKVTGLISYAGDVPALPWLAPAWIVAMWILFATSLNSSLKWLKGRYALAALMGAVFGPLSYRAGAALGAASFPQGEVLTMFVLAAIWGAVMPLLLWINSRLQK